MATKTTFCPATDAFAFDNSWPIDGREIEEIRRFLAHERQGVVRALARSPLARWAVRQIRRRRLIDGVLEEEHLTRYGLCGGMAYAALDYYRQGWVVPQGTGPRDHPTHDSPAGSALRNYIWQRLLDSMQARAAKVMFLWSLALHLLPSLGGRWVLAETKREWSALKRRLDAGQPWPIGLVGRAHGSFANHQVLALGYDDPGDGTGTIAVYDSCCPRSAHTIALDFRGRSLRADESCGAHRRETRWKGFFCDAYAPARPPIAIGLVRGVTASPGPEAADDGEVTVQYTARNAGFSRCPPLALRVGVERAGESGDAEDLGGEEETRPLEAGACRTLGRVVPAARAAGAAEFIARCRLDGDEGEAIWKRLPALGAGGEDGASRRQGWRRDAPPAGLAGRNTTSAYDGKGKGQRDGARR